MEKLNNEDLQNVSAGGNSHDIPDLEYAEVLLHEHGGKCKSCGTPVQEWEPFNGPTKAGSYYNYIFLCKCSHPRCLQEMTYLPEDKDWWLPVALVD